MRIELLIKKSVYILSIIAVILTAVLCFYPSATASAVVVPAFESTAVLDDLNGMTIDGKEFDVANYPKDPYGVVKPLTFVEYCYSQYDNKMGNYGLYIYLNNTGMIKFNDMHVLNKISMAIEYNEDDHPCKYKKFGLKFCSKSSDGQFYKYKVIDTDNEILRVVENYAKGHGGQRNYYVSEVELLKVGDYNATAYNVGRQYVYEGFAKGYGDSDNFPLTMKSLGIKTIQTDLKYAFYRPDGESSEGNHTQHQLNSVYFSVPDTYVEEYGLLSAVHMEWYEYLTKEILVVGNKSIYDTFKSLLNLSKNDSMSLSKYGFTVHTDSMSTWYSGVSAYYNLGAFYSSMYDFTGEIDVLNYLFYSYDVDAKDYSVSSEDLLEYIQNFEGSGELINGKYYKELFEDYVGEGRKIDHNDLTVQADDKFSLTSYKLDQNWFQKLFGIKDYNLTVFDEIDGIVRVTSKDVTGSKSAVCSKLYIDESNYDEFMSYYNTIQQGSEKRSVYLLRYAVTDYYSVPVTIVERLTEGVHGLTNYLGKVDENAYMARQTAFLDLDLIDVTFRDKEGVETVIPVVASPIDGIGSVTGPVNEPKDLNWKKIVALILGLVLLIILLVVFAPMLPSIVGVIFDIVLLPFKLIGAIFEAIRKNRSKRE